MLSINTIIPNKLTAIEIAIGVAIFLYIFLRVFWTKVVLTWRFRAVSKMSGEEFEQFVAEVLTKRGFKDVSLTQKSNDFGVDIIARYRKIRYAIQVKRYSQPVGVSAVQEAYTGAKHYELDAAIVITNSDFTRAAYNLAESCNVVLVTVVDFLDAKFAKKLDQIVNEQNVI